MLLGEAPYRSLELTLWKALMLPAPHRYAIALVGCSLLVGLGLAEVLLRSQYHQAHRKMAGRDPGRELCTMRASDPRLIYTYVPNRCGANAHGYVDADYSYEKSPTTYRIVIIGDSVASGLSRTEKFGKILEHRLNTDFAPHRGQAYEVIVLARSGYATVQELILLEEEAFLYHPDVVLWSYVLNDPAHPVYHANANGELGRFWYVPRYHVVHVLHKALFQWQEKRKRSQCAKEFHHFLHCAYRPHIAANIQKIGAIATHRHLPIIFLIHPIFEQGKTYADYSLLPVHSMLQTMATAAGLIVWDVYDAFRAYDPQELQVTSKEYGHDPWHPNVKGHTVIAEYLYEKLTHELLVDATPQHPR
jgi:lysophospholipase L1-like esterase